ncbi:MAG: glycoside hydrolase family 43 protein [Muribaculum sp.]|nr:glycoside hydrolase family 43 protein [Muribaculum sp.]
MNNLRTLSILILAMAFSALPLEAKPDTKMPKEEDMSAYLFTFFNDATHSLFMATSHDGYEFTAVNEGNPVISGDTIAEQRGIRDPHILRGPDGKFYMVMTDLHLSAMRNGFRNTEWERPTEYGWGNNRGIVLMKSDDLINWTHNEVRIDKLFPEKYSEVGCFWAPETIYDPEEGKMMVYFTLRERGEKLVGGEAKAKKTRLFYAYTDPEFTTFVTEPKELFVYPDTDIQILDADIIRMPDGKYFMTYCAQENPGGVKFAISDKINSGYVYSDEWIDTEPGACEAPTTWKRIGEDKWVVMYDVFSIHPHNFGFVETSDFKTFTPLGHFNDGVMKATNFKSPKHGAVIQITKEEATRLEEHWKQK